MPQYGDATLCSRYPTRALYNSNSSTKHFRHHLRQQYAVQQQTHNKW